MAITGNQEYHRKGSRILDMVRISILAAAKNDADLWFKINRYVYARLQLEERKVKNKIKRSLGRPTCSVCGRQLRTIKGIHLHRPDETKGYSLSNAVLTHKKCHEKHHASR